MMLRLHFFVWLVSLACCWPTARCFLPLSSHSRRNSQHSRPAEYALAQTLLSDTDAGETEVVLKSYQYDGWNLTYQWKPASEGYQDSNPVLLVHPVGIGLSSWFWDRFMEEWEGPALVAVDLIGCGIQHGGDAWDPDTRGLSVPLGWVKGCEALMQQVVAEEKSSNKRTQFSFPFTGGNKEEISSGQFSVVVQGGLAPVGVLLASRNPNSVTKLVMTSPPTFEQMTTGVPEEELKKNYEFLRSPLSSGLAFGLLETRWAVQFFSNLFLFAEPCDETWLDEAMNEACEEARPPVQVSILGFVCIAPMKRNSKPFSNLS